MYSKVAELNLDIGHIEIDIAQKSLFFNKYKFCERNKIIRKRLQWGVESAAMSGFEVCYENGSNFSINHI